MVDQELMKYGEEKALRGVPISPGVALGCVCLFRQSRTDAIPIHRITDELIEQEEQRLDAAKMLVKDRLGTLRQVAFERIGPAEAEIFVAQNMIIDDPAIGASLSQAIGRGSNAEMAVVDTFEDYERQLGEVDDDYLRERVSDLSELKHRMLVALGGSRHECRRQRTGECSGVARRVVFVKELTPALVLEMAEEQIAGFVAEVGGDTSHGAILARALGLPAVTGLEDVNRMAACGTEVLVNGSTGDVVLFPSETTVSDAVSDSGEVPLDIDQSSEAVEGLVVMANISMSSDIEDVLAMGAEGIGLYRTEFEFLAAGRLLSEDEQYERYSKVAGAMDSGSVCFRLLDIGAEKTCPAFSVPIEDNPALGCRGARYLLQRPDLLRDQARALARVSADHDINVMYPMIIDVEQFVELRRLFNEAVADIECGQIRHGVMFEVPAACMIAEELFAEADFGSIGSNDLVQYLFVTDRNNKELSNDYGADHNAFWIVVSKLVAAARATGKPLAICGEVAANPTLISRIVEIGVSQVSVSPRSIPAVRRAARALIS